MRPHSASYAAKAKGESKTKRKEKKLRSTLNRSLHNFAIKGSLIAAFQIIFIIVFLIALEGKLLKIEKWGTPLIISIIFSAFVLIDSIFVIINISRIRKVSNQTDIDVATIIGQDIKEAYDFSMLGLVVVDANDFVIWINEFLVGRQVNILDTNIYDSFEELEVLKEQESEKKEITLKINNCSYAVEYLRDSRMFLFRDVSDYVEEHETALKEAIVIGKLIIDTYDELSKILETKKFNDMVIETHHLIDKYFASFGALAIMSNDDEYLIMSNYENFKKMKDDRFSILETLRQNSKGDDAMAMTISIGFAHGFNESIVSLESKATKACLTALRRGGDQIIVHDSDGQNVYGGTNKIHRQQNLVKYRTYAQSLSSNIRDSSKVIIAGHRMSDMDSLGSSLGFYAFVRSVKRNNGETVPAYVVFDPNSAQSNTLATYQALKGAGLKAIFVTPNDVMDLIDEKTLVVLTDVHNPMGSLISRLFDRNSKAKSPTKVVVFDHHMKNTKESEITPILECIDPSISSCSEMVTHLLQYAEEDVRMHNMIADTLLSGIMLDTGFFKNRVDTSTYAACNLLVQKGARSENASNMLKEAYETYQLKCSIGAGLSAVYQSENFYLDSGIHIFIVCATDPKNPNSYLDEDILAKVADEHVATRDVDACFVVGRVGENIIKVSARGNGKFNVQRVAESFKDGNGGGEFDRAAVVFMLKGVTVEDIKEKIKAQIMELAYLYKEQED